MDFIVKNLRAEEFPFTTGEGLTTLGNLRSALNARTGVEKYFMRFCSAGRAYGVEESDDVLIADMVKGNVGAKDGDPSWRPLIWWCWMSDDDYSAKHCRGGFFLACQLAKK